MATPNISDLDVYSDTPLDDDNWLTNWTQTVNWLTDGTADLAVNSIAGICKITSLTTAQRNALTPTFGTTIANSDNNRIEFYDGVAWQTL